MAEKIVEKEIGKYWSKVSKTGRLKRTNWWDSDLIKKHVNRMVSGKDNLKNLSDGLNSILIKKLDGRILDNGVSVGCGDGYKEMCLLKLGILKHFMLFEFSNERIKRGIELSRKLNIENRVTFKNGNAFEFFKTESVDLVHWNNSLHHMFDVDKAVKWSYDILKNRGVFYMDDFVGPSRFQWSDKSIDIANRIRSILPQKYFLDYSNKNKYIDKKVDRYKILEDPSEAADSKNILNSVKKWFPNVEIILTGGIIYHLSLNKILYNFDENNDYDKSMLELLMLIDELYVKAGIDSHYATALAFKK